MDRLRFQEIFNRAHGVVATPQDPATLLSDAISDRQELLAGVEKALDEVDDLGRMLLEARRETEDLEMRTNRLRTQLLQAGLSPDC
jgi:hypothetical protein